ncbi:MAG: alcohol dehydrogenase, partial [Deltaproteobacteria bacterium]
MKALRFDGNLTLVDTPVPEPGVKEALIRVSCAGICNTDLEIFRGYMDFSGIPGHEFVGVVEACEDPRWVGKRVVGEINLGCGSCPRCRRGLARHCGNRRVLGILGKDGAFAEYLTLPVANLHEVPTQLSDEAALFTEPLAAAFEILEQVHIRPDDAVLIVGDGKLAQLIARVVRTTGCRLTCLGRHPEKLEHMRRLDGIETRTDEPAGRYDVVVECSGKPEGLSIALSALVPRGTLVLKSTFHGKVTLE